jgi:hypothetical protein
LSRLVLESSLGSLESSVLAVTFSAMVVFVARQKTLYVDLVRGLRRGRPDHDCAGSMSG